MSMPADEDFSATTRWERVANTTTWGAYLNDVEKRAILNAHSRFSTPTSALEIGAEGGRWSAMLANAGWSMTCTDINPETLAICKQRVPAANCIIVQPEDTSLPCESRSLDLVLCIQVPYVIETDWFIGEASRVLRDGGRIVGVFHNGQSWRGLLGRRRSSSSGGFAFYQHSYPRWRQTLQSGGFSVEYEEGYCWPPFSRQSNSALVPHLARAERLLGLRKLARISPWVAFIAQKTPGTAGVAAAG